MPLYLLPIVIIQEAADVFEAPKVKTEAEKAEHYAKMAAMHKKHNELKAKTIEDSSDGESVATSSEEEPNNQ